MRLTIPEILQLVSDARTHQEKVALLRKHQSLVLEQVLQYNFHPDIRFNLPEGEAPYKRETDVPVGKSHTNLYQEGRRLYLFLEGYATNLKPYKREMLFIEMLEGVHYTEADLLVAVKDKRMEDLYPGVTYEAAYEAFAQLVPHPSQRPPKVVKEEVKQEADPLPQATTPEVTEVVAPKKKGGPKKGKPMSEEQKKKLSDLYWARVAAKKAAAGQTD